MLFNFLMYRQQMLKENDWPQGMCLEMQSNNKPPEHCKLCRMNLTSLRSAYTTTNNLKTYFCIMERISPEVEGHILPNTLGMAPKAPACSSVTCTVSVRPYNCSWDRFG